MWRLRGTRDQSPGSPELFPKEPPSPEARPDPLKDTGTRWDAPIASRYRHCGGCPTVKAATLLCALRMELETPVDELTSILAITYQRKFPFGSPCTNVPQTPGLIALQGCAATTSV